LIQIANLYTYNDYNKVSFSPEQEEAICRIVSGDNVAKLELVKTCMDLVVKFANWYSFEYGTSFSQLVQIGVLTVIRTAEKFYGSENTDFNNYLSQEIMKAMMVSAKR
jgi:DNA-directed RNA polymerase specialized sigma subunit